MKTISSLLVSLAGILASSAAILEKSVAYEHGEVALEGFHAYDDAFEGKRPGILIIHQWTGLTDYEKMRARMLAELGYNVFAADVYGAGIRPQPPEAGEVAGDDISKGAAYDAKADERSWECMQRFFAEIFVES